jgi:hypothetical protein
VNPSQKLTMGGMCVGMAAACLVAGYLVSGSLPRKDWAVDTAGAPEVPPEVDMPAEAPKPELHRYNVTIETHADWSRVILQGGAFVMGDADNGLNTVELSSEAPEQVVRFVYSAGEVAIRQKQFATARIIVTGVVETAQPVLEVRLGHGDNGAITIRTPAETFTHDKVLGDGVNFVTKTIRLE